MVLWCGLWLSVSPPVVVVVVVWLAILGVSLPSQVASVVAKPHHPAVW